MQRILGMGSVIIAAVLLTAGLFVTEAQNSITGEWKASTRDQKGDKIQLSFERRTERGGRNSHSSSFAYSDLQGLSPDRTQNGQVSFKLEREAGVIECEGSFTNGVGAGTFRFTPNAGYIEAMRSRGFDFAKPNKGNGPSQQMDDRLFSAATLNITTALADDLNSANFGPLTVDDLFKAAIFKVDSKFISEMKASGFPNLGMEELVKARIFKIDGDYVRQVRDMGFVKEDFEGMVKFRIFKVTPEFLSELKNEGFAELTSEEVVKFRIFNIDPEFIRAARTEEPNITVEQLVQRKIGIKRR
ncbi:MAG: hypothetical protein ABI539_05910 [Acidobacteriota bacterium]